MPQQARSAATVEAIYEAAFQIMEKCGARAFTTIRVAERAGVSVGTLYQYFADKDDLLASVARKRTERVRKVASASLAAQPKTGSVRPIVRALIEALDGKHGARVALIDALSREEGRHALAQQQRTFMNAIGEQIDPQGALPKEARFILTRLAVSLVCMAALDDSVQLSPEGLEDELVFLIESYVSALGARIRR